MGWLTNHQLGKVLLGFFGPGTRLLEDGHAANDGGHGLARCNVSPRRWVFSLTCAVFGAFPYLLQGGPS